MGTESDQLPPAPPAAAESTVALRRLPFSERVQQFVRAIREGDEAMVEELVLRISQSRRWLGPLAFLVGAFAVLFQGLRLLVLNWRLTLVQLLPAVWIWAATYDLRAHVLHGKSYNVLRGPILIPLVLGVAAITAASFYLNAVFGFAIAQPGGVPKIRPAVSQARTHMAVILLSGGFVGVLLGVAAFIVTRAGRPWFALSLGIVIGLMMVAYVAVPAWLIGVKPKASTREKLATSALGGAVGAVICTPPYMISRLGILMLDSKLLFVPGLVITALGATLAAASTSAVKAVKMSAKLVDRPAADHPPVDPAPANPPPGEPVP